MTEVKPGQLSSKMKEVLTDGVPKKIGLLLKLAGVTNYKIGEDGIIRVEGKENVELAKKMLPNINSI